MSTNGVAGEQSSRTPTIDPWLREILRCPACRSELRDEVGPTGTPELVCSNETTGDCARAYRVEDGIPVLLADEARATLT